MNWFSGGVVYICLWWLVFFISLPVGIHSVREAGGSGETGNDAGAPIKHHLKWKLLATTVIAALFWGVAYWVISSADMLSFRAH